MSRTLLLTAAIAMIATTAAAQNSPEAQRVRAVLAATPLIDGHNDLPWQVASRWAGDARQLDVTQDLSQATPPIHTDIARLRAGGVGGQFWSVFVPASLDGPAATAQVMVQIDLVRELVRRHPDVFQMAFTADDIERAHAEGRIASLNGMEGGNALNNSLAVLRSFYELGARYITLTHSANLDWADASTDEAEHDGLTPFGVAVVREMNRLGMLVDLSHVSEATMNDALDATRAPVIFSHSSAFALDNHPRNVPDAVLLRVRDNGGVVMVTFVPGFISQEIRDWNQERNARRAWLSERGQVSGEAGEAELEAAMAAWDSDNPQPIATLSQVANHIEHIRDVAGIDHVGLGGDYDGIETTVEGLNGVEDYPALLEELALRGWSDAELAKLAGGNVLRVMRRAEAVAADLADEPANFASISELDGASE